MTFRIFWPSLTEIVTGTLGEIANNSCQAMTADYSIDVGGSVIPNIDTSNQRAGACNTFLLASNLDPHTSKGN